MKLGKQDHKSLALWAADCAGHLLPYSEKRYPKDKRPRNAINVLRKWIRTEGFKMPEIRSASLASHAAARKATNPAAKFAARAAGQAVAAAHVPEHAFGVTYYGLKAVMAAHPSCAKSAAAKELDWQSQHLPKKLQKPWRGWMRRRLPKNIREIISL
jgi:hypothetical protein